VPEPLLAFTRTQGDSRIFAAFNLSPETVQTAVQLPAGTEQVESVGVLTGELRDERLMLPGHGVVFARVPS
jgi:alpha-glucosidase